MKKTPNFSPEVHVSAIRSLMGEVLRTPLPEEERDLLARDLYESGLRILAPDHLATLARAWDQGYREGAEDNRTEFGRKVRWGHARNPYREDT